MTRLLGRPDDGGAGPGASRLAPVLVFAMALALAIAAGYSFSRVDRMLSRQAPVGSWGQSVEAHVETIEIERTGASPACLAVFRYNRPRDGAIVRRQLRSSSMERCERYEAGQTVTAWVVPGDTRIFILDEERIAPHWYWVTLALFVLFTLLALAQLRAMLGIRRKPPVR